ncbi:MAG: GlsB/YeaQ/YmgE family stress response membrane protein [Bacteroidota bacterium]
MNIIYMLIIGAIAGWLAGNFFKGRGFGLLWNILLGIAGAVVGGFLFGIVGLTTNGLIGELISATVGAVIVLWVSTQLKK